jgi:hypothetical protein
MTIESLRLEIRAKRTANERTFIPVKSEPAHSVENAADHFSRRTLEVSVFDAQDEHAASAPGEQPVEKRGASAADVEVTRGGRGESDADGVHWVIG